MSSKPKNMKLKVNVVVDSAIRDHGDEPNIQERAKKAVAVLKKHGVPKSFEKNK